ncbi:MAG: amidohydrolase family protein [Pseudomonadota bacterium]
MVNKCLPGLLGAFSLIITVLIATPGFAFSPAVHAQSNASNGDTSQANTSPTLYLTADHYVDVRNGVRVPDAAIIVRGERIAAIGTTTTLPAPPDAREITLAPGMTLMPGLIDMHVHLTSNPKRGDYSQPEQFEVIHGVVNARRTLMAGFTTVRNVGSSRYTDVALRDAINDGLIDGPRMYVSGPPVGIIGGHCSDDTYSPPEAQSTGENVATGPWEMRAQVRKNIKYGVDLIKTCSTGGVFSRGTLLGAPQGTVEELKAIADEAHMRGLKVAAHAHGTVGIKNALKAGIDTIEHASFLDDEAIRMAKKNGAFLSMDIFNTEYTLSKGEENGVSEESLNKEREVGTIQRQSFTKAVKAGAKVILGTDAAIFPHGDNAMQLSRMVRFGMTPAQALRAATSLAAEALGREKELGQLAPGFRADIIGVMGDPLSDVSLLETVSFVMKDGVLYKSAQ